MKKFVTKETVVKTVNTLKTPEIATAVVLAGAAAAACTMLVRGVSKHAAPECDCCCEACECECAPEEVVEAAE